jgi:hypothetical protein
MNLIKIVLFLFKLLLLVYFLGLVLVYLFQENLIFFPERLPSDFHFNFQQPFIEISIPVRNQKVLNGLLFKAPVSKGLIFYLHGNGGSLCSWGEVASLYTSWGYDLFMLDYRGYGKSTGHIQGEEQIYNDVLTAYDSICRGYTSNQIIILGYSLGTGPASWLASKNTARLLILQAPYYSFQQLGKQKYPLFPMFLNKYKLPVYQYLELRKMPVVIFHGDADEVIPYSNSLQLKLALRPGDDFICLHGQGHNNMSDNPVYRAAIKEMLNN